MPPDLIPPHARSSKRNLFLFLSTIGILTAIPLTVYLVIQAREPAGKAAPVVIDTNTTYQMGVLDIRYFPTQDGVNLDSSVTGVVSSLNSIRTKVNRITNETRTGLEEASRYQGYKNPNAQPALAYNISDTKEYLQPLPIGLEVPWKPGQGIYRPNYMSILQNLNICDYVVNHGVREVWLYGWHYGNIEPAESNMASQSGDISNSERSNDLPVCSKTYVLYNYNFSRDTAEALHNHGHQLEAILSYIDSSTYNNSFIGPWQTYGSNDGSGSNFHRCGWTHEPPNSRSNGEPQYDYSNTRFVWTDCEDWTTGGTGQKSYINCDRWSCSEVGFHIWQWQNMPGRNNNVPGATNWWDFFGDWDTALSKQEKLVYASYTRAGDFNNDGLINAQDLAVLVLTWNSTTDLRADLNGDGRVNAGDLARLISKWGT